MMSLCKRHHHLHCCRHLQSDTEDSDNNFFIFLLVVVGHQRQVWHYFYHLITAAATTTTTTAVTMVTSVKTKMNKTMTMISSIDIRKALDQVFKTKQSSKQKGSISFKVYVVPKSCKKTFVKHQFDKEWEWLRAAISREAYRTASPVRVVVNKPFKKDAQVFLFVRLFTNIGYNCLQNKK